VRDAGGIPELLAPKAGQARAFNHLDKAGTFPVDRAISDADPAGYDALVLPGGVANPDQLRTIPAAVEFTRALLQAGKPAAVICHGPWTLVEADLVRGRTLTSWPSLQTDIRNAGGTWVDSEVQVCTAGANVLVTSRKPDDLPAFCKHLVEKFQQAG
jgi:protease I